MSKKQNHAHWKAAGRLVSALCLCVSLALLLCPAAEPSRTASMQSELRAPAVQQTGEVQSFGKKLIPLGRTTGIKLYSEGTMVVGFSSVSSGGDSPAERDGLETGDVIIALNGSAVTSNESLVRQLSELEDGQTVFTILRDGQRREVEVDAVYDQTSASWRIGAWIRDSIAGIGTITFVDPASGAFGALGHGVCDADTGELMPFGSGAVMASEVAAVQKGQSGKPGQLSGTFDLYTDQGVLWCNTATGIFGKLENERLYAEREAMELAAKSEIHTGAATILSNVSGTETREYRVEILRVYGDGAEGRDLMLRVTDPELLATTGGIVQGMSGSPILQNGKLVGAVTHVLVNDPTRGYGISIQTMLVSLPK